MNLKNEMTMKKILGHNQLFPESCIEYFAISFHRSERTIYDLKITDRIQSSPHLAV